MKFVSSLLIAALCWALSACGVHVEGQKESLNQANARLVAVERPKRDLTPYLSPLQSDYRMGPGDRIGVDIAGYPDLSRRGLLVRPDGKVSVFLLEDVLAAGSSPSELARSLEASYSKFFKAPPKVLVTLDECLSQRFMVLGAVDSPGIFALNGPTTVLEAIAQAGGAATSGETGKPVGDLSRAYLVRGDDLVPVDFARLFSGDRRENVYIRTGDLIYIPSRFSGEVFVIGEVAQPKVLQIDGHLTLLRALTEAGWVSREAKESAVRVIRGSLVDPKVYYVDAEDIAAGAAADVDLQPGDVVFVSTTELADFELIMRQITPILSTAVQALFMYQVFK